MPGDTTASGVHGNAHKGLDYGPGPRPVTASEMLAPHCIGMCECFIGLAVLLVIVAALSGGGSDGDDRGGIGAALLE